MTISNGARAPLSKLELVGLVAAVMAMTALTIDMMLAALGDISRDFDLGNDNDRQYVVAAFMLGSGVAQLFYGPLADRYGRRAVFIWSLIGFLAATLLCVVATAYSLFIAGRALQGVASAAGRVVAIALVRDLYKGRDMAGIMSMAMTIATISPILAPGIGQIILLFAPWRYVFVVLFLFAAVLLFWIVWRLPETLALDKRQKLSFDSIKRMLVFYASDRNALGYTVASMCIMGALFGYIISSQQIYVESFGIGALFPLALASGAFAFSAAAMINAKLVRRIGMRRLSHGALIAFALINAMNALYIALSGGGSLTVFLAFLMPAFFAMGLINANLSAIVMEPMGAMAGTASAVFGFATMTGAALLGGIAAQLYNGTAAPVVAAFSVFGFAALAAVLASERGRLFKETPADALP